MPTSAVTVAVTATQIAAYNDRRVFLVIENVGTQTIYLGDDSSVATTTGVRLEAGDFWVHEPKGTNVPFYRGSFWGIVAATTAGVQVLELIDARQ